MLCECDETMFPSSAAAAAIACQIASTTFQCDSLSTIFSAHFMHMFPPFYSHSTCGTVRNQIRVHYPIYETINDTILSLSFKITIFIMYTVQVKVANYNNRQSSDNSFFLALVSVQFNTILSIFCTILFTQSNLISIEFSPKVKWNKWKQLATI